MSVELSLTLLLKHLCIRQGLDGPVQDTCMLNDQNGAAVQ